MRVLPRFGGLVATSLLAAGPVAAQAADFSQTVTFGDSLTHNRLLGFPFRTALTETTRWKPCSTRAR